MHTGDILTGVNLACPQVMQAAMAGLYAHLHRLGVVLQLRADEQVLGLAQPRVPAWHALLTSAELVVCTSDAVAQALLQDLAGCPRPPALQVQAG